MRSVSAVVALAVICVGQLVNGSQQDLWDLSAATSAFSQNLYTEVALDKPNVVYSPYSIHSALTMTSMGARDDTANEMLKTLQLNSLNGSSPHTAYHDLIIELSSVTNVKLLTANAVFVNPNKPIETDFLTEITQEYFATTENFDLQAPGGPEAGVNDFVANRTEHEITKVLAPGSIDTNTMLILVNTIFFNGSWHDQFKKNSTNTSDFQQLNGAKSKVEMMHSERFVNIKRDNSAGIDVAELPFKGDRFSLYIALPQQVEGITNFEHQLSSPGKVDGLFEGLTRVRVQLAIPKFKIETEIHLSNALRQMGMVKAFDPFTANFTGISKAGHLYISEVLHKAVIDVQETGTVAAAATVVGTKTMVIFNPPTETFIADHPFLFFLRDNHSKQILFQGKFSG